LARVVASLNHPNICALYDIGPNYVVLELIEGTVEAGSQRNGLGMSRPGPKDQEPPACRAVASSLRGDRDVVGYRRWFRNALPILDHPG